MVRITDRPDMTLDVYRGRKTTIQQQQRTKVCKKQIQIQYSNLPVEKAVNTGNALCNNHRQFLACQ